MELAEVYYSDIDTLVGFEPDFFITASGHESRSTAIAKQFDYEASQKIVISFIENKTVLSRPANDKFFKLKNFRFYEASAFDPPDFIAILGEIVKPELKILLDITVMPGLWYHSFFNYIQTVRKCRRIEVKVTYVPAVFKDLPKTGNRIELMQSPKIYKSEVKVRNQKKKALIMGLGADKSISNKVYEIIQPDIAHLLHADPAVDQKYVEKVLISNHQIISRTPIRNLHSYPIRDTKLLYNKLVDLIMPLRMDWQVTIIPLGPKIFSLMAILIQFSYPDIELFYPKYKIKSLKDKREVEDVISVDLLFSLI